MSIPYTKTTPHRFDVVGSFLRPEKLRQARAAYEAGKLGADELKAVEDVAITDLVAKQQKAGLGVITDGEFRRATWHLDFMWAFAGIGHSKTEAGIPFHDEAAKIDDTYLTDKLSIDHHPFVDHFDFVHGLEDDKSVAKLTIPAPAQFLFQLLIPQNLAGTQKIYPNQDELIDDLVAGYIHVLSELNDHGCKNVQIDDCTWGVIVDPHAQQILATDQAGLDAVAEQLLEINNRVLDGRPDSMTINTHVCRGNFHSTWACEGSYEGVAHTLLAREHADNFFLEFDDDRSGGFEPLAAVPADKGVVLGLVTTKAAHLEDPDQLVSRINEAAEYVSLDRLYLSPQCGFASCEIGNKLTEDEQWAKVALVKSVAERVWG